MTEEDYTIDPDVFIEYTRDLHRRGVNVLRTTIFYAARLHRTKPTIILSNEHDKFHWMTKEEIESEKHCIEEFRQDLDRFEEKIRERAPLIVYKTLREQTSDTEEIVTDQIELN